MIKFQQAHEEFTTLQTIFPSNINSNHTTEKGPLVKENNFFFFFSKDASCNWCRSIFSSPESIAQRFQCLSFSGCF